MVSLNAPPTRQSCMPDKDIASLSAFSETQKLRDETLAKHGITLGAMIGEGGQGSVFRGTCCHGSVAIKILRKLSGVDGLTQRAHVNAEVNILCEVEHERALRLLIWFEDHRHYYVVTELVDGKDLFDVATSYVFTENQILLICSDVVDALRAMHVRGIAHRDIKLENVLLDMWSFRATLIDFGFACKLSLDKEGTSGMEQFPGTLKYQAPEIIRRDVAHDPFRADMYALGVMAYMLVCGSYPFDGQTLDQVRAAICEGAVRFDQSVWKRVTPEAKMLIRALLSSNAEQRPTAEQLGDALDQLMRERSIDLKVHPLHSEVTRAMKSQEKVPPPIFERMYLAANAKKLAVFAQNVKHNCAPPKLTISPRLLGLFGVNDQHSIS